MKPLLILIFLVAGTLTSLAQKETTSRVTNRVDAVNVKPIALTKAQQDWLNINYKQLARLRRDSATTLVRKTFPSVTEASLDAILGQALKMQMADNQPQIEELKAKKQTLLNKIVQKEAELAATSDTVKRERLRVEILSLKTEVAHLDEMIRKLQNGQ